MDLAEAVQARRPEEKLAAELREWQGARQTLDLILPRALPSEEAVARRLHGEAERSVAWLEFERRFKGRVDLESLLRLSRGDLKTPRWFLYDVMRSCDAVVWGSHPMMTFELMKASRLIHRIVLPYSNPFARRARYVASPIILPSKIRERALALHAEGITPYVLYEPRVVNSVPIPRPDPALVVETHGAYFLVEMWEDTVAEDPRALNTLREFFT